MLPQFPEGLHESIVETLSYQSVIGLNFLLGLKLEFISASLNSPRFVVRILVEQAVFAHSHFLTPVPSKKCLNSEIISFFAGNTTNADSSVLC